MNFVFIVDDSPCMGIPGEMSTLTPLEICKAAVEQFLISVRQLLPQDQHQFMLLHTGPDRSCILSMYNEPLGDFEIALKNLQVSSTDRDISYAISLAFTTINKYRIRSGTDRFGAGRLASVTEPTTVIFFSTGESLQGKEILLSKGSMSAGSDLYYEPFRWDQKFFPFMLSLKGCSKIDIREVQSLAEATGGELVVSDNLQSMLGNVKSLAQKAILPSVVVKVTVDSNVHDEYKNVMVLTKLIGKHAMEWPIPEAFWVDKNVDNIPIRSAHPIIRIQKERGSLNDELSLLKEFDCFHDNYEMFLAFSSSQFVNNGGHGNRPNLYKVFGLDLEKRYLVYVRGSQRLDGNSTDPMNLRQPCGVLSPGKSSIGGAAELLILPIDFPKLLNILKNALACRQCLTASVRADMGYYLWSSPGYYYMALASLLQKLGLSHLIQVPESCIFGKGVGKRLQRLQQVASSDIVNLEFKKKERWSPMPIDPFSLTSMFFEGLSASLPNDIATEDILGVWNRLGKSLYGHEYQFTHGVSIRLSSSSYILSSKDLGYFSVTRKFVQPVSSLSIFLRTESKKSITLKCRRDDNTVSGVDEDKTDVVALKKFSSNYRLRESLHRNCGGCMISQEVISQMGNYAILLARKEIGRDPTTELTKEEDTPFGVLRRKLNINFGSPFKKIGRKVSDNTKLIGHVENLVSNISSLDEMQHTILEMFVDTPMPERDYQSSDDGSFPNGGNNKRKFSSVEADAGKEHSIEVLSQRYASPPPESSTTSETACNSQSIYSTPEFSNNEALLFKDESRNVQETLPPGWLKQYSKSKKRDYWFNTSTGVSSWIHPNLL